MSSPKTQHTWIVVQEFKDEPTGIIVRITSNDAFRPRYTIQIGRVLPNDARTVGSYVPVYIDDGNGEANLRTPISPVISDLVKQAEAWVLSRSQDREDAISKSKADKRKSASPK